MRHQQLLFKHILLCEMLCSVGSRNNRLLVSLLSFWSLFSVFLLLPPCLYPIIVSLLSTNIPKVNLSSVYMLIIFKMYTFNLDFELQTYISNYLMSPLSCSRGISKILHPGPDLPVAFLIFTAFQIFKFLKLKL